MEVLSPRALLSLGNKWDLLSPRTWISTTTTLLCRSLKSVFCDLISLEHSIRYLFLQTELYLHCYGSDKYPGQYRHSAVHDKRDIFWYLTTVPLKYSECVPNSWVNLWCCVSASCGSCYSFASMGMLEARLRILTNNSQTPALSPQQIVSCSEYSQGTSSFFFD